MAAKRRTLTIRGREYPVLLPSIRDPRLHVAVVLLTLQALGQTVLDFRLSVAQILICLAAGALIEFGYEFGRNKVIMWPASGLLTGNSTAFILRVPGTFHWHWWSTRGWWIFAGVVAFSMISKYVIRYRGRHIFNPSNLGLVLAFVALGPAYTEPQDLWWIPMGQWMIVTYAILIGGGLFIAWELKLLGLELGYMAAFALFAALALLPVPDHCMIASWYATPMCGQQLWQILVTSPEVLIFAFFMIPDPRTVPDGQVGRFVFGVIVALLSVVLLGPTTLEFWTKTAILASLVFACAGRFALMRLVAPLEEAGGGLRVLRAMGWSAPAVLGVSALLVTSLPLSAQLSLHSVIPAPELPDGTRPTLALTIGSANAQDIGSWAVNSARVALPPSGSGSPTSASARVWVVPPLPNVSVPDNVAAFDSKAAASATQMAHAVVLNLMIESEARRAHDPKLAADGAVGDALTEFTDVIQADGSGKFVQKTYSFDRVELVLYLPKFSTQASRLVGVFLHGTTTLITRDSSGNVLSQQTLPYAKAWGLDQTYFGLIINDFTDLNRA
ncbi:MAG: hypothetical protein E6I92_01945 [Chloroflexi bacterium]|nr:MAG: hypothetical protein E6I92_01945 [Chloroflexota bacterium]